ncbi:MAG: hypothetical protein C0501_11290 [Isosphaera sp.]|nr:hypothetical protein [Isosphaera sp.]
MTTYDFVHLVLYAAGGEIRGRTKLQKMVYFAGALTGDPRRLGYRAHYYGPYSAEVADAVEELRGLKFLEQRAAGAGTTDEHGFEIARYDYTLTEEGRQVAAEKAAAAPAEWPRIRAAVEKLAAAPVRDYVRLAIAAKTHLLTRQAGRGLAGEALRAETAAHGWKAFTDEQYDEALQFLEAVGLPVAGDPA